MIYLQIIQAISAVLLIAVVLMQNQNGGVGGVFGGDVSVKTTRRGIDKTLHNFTIILSIIFFLSALAGILVS